LEAQGKDDKPNLVKISNLEKQIEEMGLDESDLMKDFMHRRRTAMSQGHLSVFDSADNDQREAGEQIFQLEHFDKLKDPSTWKTQAGPGSNPSLWAKAMMEFSSNPIRQALTQLPKQEETAAVLNFQDLLRVMGDLPDVSRATRDDPVLKLANTSQTLCDEVYVQLMKQLTNNPSPASCNEGWKLLQKLIETAMPSPGLVDFVRRFLVVTSDGSASRITVTKMKSRGSVRRQLSRSASVQFWSQDLPETAGSALKKFIKKGGPGGLSAVAEEEEEEE